MGAKASSADFPASLFEKGRPHVATISSQFSFVDILAQGLWREAGEDPLALASMQILLPTRRSCRLLREAFLRATGGKAALLPRMRPLGETDEDELLLTEGKTDFALPPVMPPLRRQMLLMRLIAQKDPSLPLDQSLELADALGALLDQVQAEGLDFSNLKNLVPDSYAEHWKETLLFLEIVTKAWPLVLEQEGAIDGVTRRTLLLQQQARLWEASPPPFPVIAAGSTASIPAVADLLACVARLPQGLVILPGLDQNADEETWQAVGEEHPQFCMKAWLDKIHLARADVLDWPLSPLVSPRVRLVQEAMRPASVAEGWRSLTSQMIPSSALDGFHRLEADTSQDEAEAIAVALRAALEEEGKTAALVTPDRALAERVASSLRRWGIEADDSGGAPLSTLPVGRFLDVVLRAADPDASAVDYLSLLKHPLTACGLASSECRRRARRVEVDVWRGVRRSRGFQGAAEALAPKNPDLSVWLSNLAALFDPITSTWHEEIPLPERIAAHIALAEKLGASDAQEGWMRLWHGDAGEKAATWLDEWKQAAKDFPPVTGEAYAAMFIALVRKITIRPLYGQHPRLDILGPLEARLWHPDLIIIGGMNEGTWPPEVPADPWLSRPMRKAFGLPAPERRTGLSAHDFVQLASAKEVLLTRSRRAGTSPTVPSRFLLQTEVVLTALGLISPRKSLWGSWARTLDRPASTEIKPCKAPEPQPPLAVRPTTLSVTEIGTWRRNPYAIYAKHILDLHPLDPIEADAAAAERGTLIHAALEDFIKNHGDAWPSGPLEVLLSIGRALFEPYRDRPQVVAFWWPRFERIAAWFIAQEEERRARGIRTLSVEASGSISFAGDRFRLRGRADRIDLLAEGFLEIIDYKTGLAPSDKQILAGYEPQLPLLALMASQGAFENVPSGASFAALSHWRLQGGADIAEIKSLTNSIDVAMERARQGLEDLLTLFADPSTPYHAVPKPRFAPKYNDYAHLARQDEWGRAGETT